MIENEKLVPVINRQYSLEQAADAHRNIEKGHKKGNVAIYLSQEN
jgi:hypothetical protein